MRDDELQTPDARAWIGATLLDRMARKLPGVVREDWLDLVDLVDLDVGFQNACVLSYAVPDYSFDEACEALGLVTRPMIVAAGFTGNGVQDIDALTRAWSELIQARRGISLVG
jgi:hypothetical protein